VGQGAYASNTATTTIGAAGYFTFNIIGPTTGSSITPPAPSGTTFTVNTTGTYHFTFSARGTPGTLTPPHPIVLRLFDTTAAAAVTGTQFASDSQATSLAAFPNGTELCVGSGIATLTSGHTIVLQNWTATGTDTVALNSVPLGGDATINASLAFIQVA
jgi:hypothetical protein